MSRPIAQAYQWICLRRLSRPHRPQTCSLTSSTTSAGTQSETSSPLPAPTTQTQPPSPSDENSTEPFLHKPFREAFLQREDGLALSLTTSHLQNLITSAEKIFNSPAIPRTWISNNPGYVSTPRLRNLQRLHQARSKFLSKAQLVLENLDDLQKIPYPPTNADRTKEEMKGQTRQENAWALRGMEGSVLTSRNHAELEAKKLRESVRERIAGRERQVLQKERVEKPVFKGGAGETERSGEKEVIQEKMHRRLRFRKHSASVIRQIPEESKKGEHSVKAKVEGAEASSGDEETGPPTTKKLGDSKVKPREEADEKGWGAGGTEVAVKKDESEGRVEQPNFKETLLEKQKRLDKAMKG